MSWKTEVLVSGEWSTNSVVLSTEEEAKEYGRELLSRWMVPIDSRAVPSNESVNYKFDFTAYRLVAIA